MSLSTRVIAIIGSREIGRPEAKKTMLLMAAKAASDGDVEIVSGGARGADSIAREVATELGIAFREFPADWEKHGKPAGMIRNKEMAKVCSEVWAFWDGKSPGTRQMIAFSRSIGRPVTVIES